MLVIGAGLIGCSNGVDPGERTPAASKSHPAVLAGTGPDVAAPAPSRVDASPNVLIVPAGYEVIGACSYVGSFACWDVDGTPSKELEARVAETVDAASESGMHVTPGKKNRLIVASRSPAKVSTEALQLEGARSTGTLGWQDQEKEGNVMIFGAAVAVETGELTGSTNSWEKQAEGAIRLKSGAEFRFPGLRLVFRGIEVSPAMSPRTMRRFDLQFSFEGDASQAKVVARPIGLSGKLVESIDEFGNPVDIQTWRPPRSVGGVGTHFAYAQGSSVLKFDHVAKRATARIYVQPIKVSRLDLELLKVSDTRSVRVPLDPK